MSYKEIGERMNEAFEQLKQAGWIPASVKTFEEPLLDDLNQILGEYAGNENLTHFSQTRYWQKVMCC